MIKNTTTPHKILLNLLAFILWVATVACGVWSMLAIRTMVLRTTIRFSPVYAQDLADPLPLVNILVMVPLGAFLIVIIIGGAEYHRTRIGQENTLVLVWTWQAEAWTWPRDVWIAQSQDGGVTFSGSRKITRTGGPIRAVSQDGMYYVLYRVAENDGQSLILATSVDQGDSWTARKVQDEIPLKLDVMKGPGLGMAPDGTIDVAFYALPSVAMGGKALASPAV